MNFCGKGPLFLELVTYACMRLFCFCWTLPTLWRYMQIWKYIHTCIAFCSHQLNERTPRLGYTYVTASSAAFQFGVNYRGTQLTASAVDNRSYVSPWGGVNWLRRTAVNRGTAAVQRCTTYGVPRCTAVYRDVIAVHRDNFHRGKVHM